ncbi:hypothetical protein [Polaribacter sp. SA4-12]|uniref:hypothetical protein n=1 Tax=Polaribacter sp. SA4-12 TaxID=1312072 RepID=UPI000B3BE5D0|nr:hypothetical protein [Polaribacter sp. SA4-12]ARV16649.1 hypothetical protein BTO07_16560 [Polaribacter sp. SA4-12]
MNSSRNLSSTLLKAICLATVLFWILIIPEDLNQISPLFIVSIIPIAIVCSLTILVTITPFFWLAKEGVTDHEIFKKYFPYYSIITFGILIYFVILSNFESFVCAFFITAFITLMQSWIWICKPNSIIQQNKNLKNNLNAEI